MPHQCTSCGRVFPDGSKEMLSGCPDCGGNKFQYRPQSAGADSDDGGNPVSGGGPQSASGPGPDAAGTSGSPGRDATAGSQGTDEPTDGPSATERASAAVRDLVGLGSDDATAGSSDDAPERTSADSDGRETDPGRAAADPGETEPDPEETEPDPGRTDADARTAGSESSGSAAPGTPDDASGSTRERRTDRGSGGSTGSGPRKPGDWTPTGSVGGDAFGSGRSDTADADRAPGSGADDVATDVGASGAAREGADPDAGPTEPGPAVSDSADAATDDRASAEAGPAPADNEPSTTDDGPEDRAQADARGGVVEPDEIAAGGPGPDDRTGNDGPGDDGPGDDGPGDDGLPDVDGRVIEPSSDERPSIDELRRELNDQFESIRIVSPGQYELNLMELYNREEYIISLQEDGRYVIEVPESWRSGGDDA